MTSTINLPKYNRLFDSIQFLQSFQKKPYTIQVDPNIQRSVLARFEEHERMNLSDDHLWKLSTEAKERDKAAAEKATAQCKMDAFKGKYERTSADQYDEFMKVR